jgi:plastocyanin
MRTSRLIAVAVAAILLTGAGCVGSGQNALPAGPDSSAPTIKQPSAPPPGPSADTGTPPETGAVTVIIRDFSFQPGEIAVKKGTTVIWKNQDPAPHIVASDPHPAHTDLPSLSSETLSSGGEYSYTFDKVGDFGYHCHLHPSMKGRVKVTE